MRMYQTPSFFLKDERGRNSLVDKFFKIERKEVSDSFFVDDLFLKEDNKEISLISAEICGNQV